IIAMSVADIWVEVDVLPLESSGAGQSVTVILNAHDAATGRSLGSKSCRSRYANGVDYGKLIEVALDACKEEFLNTMQSKFDDIVENGRPVSIELNFSSNSSWNLDSEIGDDTFFYFLDTWFTDFAV